jgi:hypothetical protein
LVGILKVSRQHYQQLIILSEKQEIVSKTFDNVLKSKTHLETIHCGPIAHVLELQDLKDFALLAVVDERNKALVRLSGNELVCVGALLEEDLDDGV